MWLNFYLCIILISPWVIFFMVLYQKSGTVKGKGSPLNIIAPQIHSARYAMQGNTNFYLEVCLHQLKGVLWNRVRETLIPRKAGSSFIVLHQELAWTLCNNLYYMLYICIYHDGPICNFTNFLSCKSPNSTYILHTASQGDTELSARYVLGFGQLICQQDTNAWLIARAAALEAMPST